MNHSLKSCAAAFLLLAAAACAIGSTEPALEPLPDGVRPLHYRIAIEPDEKYARYAGHETVLLEIAAETREIVLHGVGLTIESAELEGKAATAIGFDAPKGRIILRFASPLQPGRRELTLRFSGAISGQGAQGLYKRSHAGPDGVSKESLFTMLCCIDTARKFAPLWDETRYKATFELELLLRGELDAFSNMPVAERRTMRDGRVRVRFLPTPPMSPYLLFFAAGELDQLRARVGGTDVGIVVCRGAGHRAAFSLEATLNVLGYLEDYLASPFSLPKLDSIAITGTTGDGGMENWGAIAYSEVRMLDGPGWSSQSALRDTHTLIAHEVAHQWFGDFVTAADWDHLWLNEGFADWMENKATQHLHPEWTVWDLGGAASREAAMDFDARSASYAITPNHSFDDAITYRKSGRVIRMLEAYVGEEKFRDALRAYMRAHGRGNATSADLWAALEAEAGPVAVAIGRDFTERKGVPLIEVLSSRCAPGGGTTQVRLRQSRFGLDRASRSPLEWRVPVRLALTGGGEAPWIVVSGKAPTVATVPGCGAVKVNAGETGYFRTRYDAASFGRLADDFGRMAPADQLGLLNDALALAEGGYDPVERYFELARRVPVSADPMVHLQLARAFVRLETHVAAHGAREPFRAAARGKLGPVLAAIGWDARDSEPANVGVLRAELVETLTGLGDAATIAEAHRRFRAGQDLAPGLREALTRAVGLSADDEAFGELMERAVAAGSNAERRLLLESAASALREPLAERALQATLTDGVPADVAPAMLMRVARAHPAMALRFAEHHRDALGPRFEPDTLEWLMPALEKAASSRLAQGSLASPIDAWLRGPASRLD